MVLKEEFTVFDALGETLTARIPAVSGADPAGANSIILEVLGGASANFTLDIQGKAHADGTFTNWDYLQIGQAGVAGLSNAQLTVNDQTVRFYLIPNTPRHVQLIATRTAGTLTVHGTYTSEVFTQVTLTTARGGVVVEGSVAHGAADDGSFPLKVGFKAESGTPDSVDDGDVVDPYADVKGRLGVFIGEKGSSRDAKVIPAGDADSATQSSLVVFSMGAVMGPDGTMNRNRSAMDIAPGIGALNVAPIGGDIVLRASAIAGEAGGTSVAVPNLGWVKSFFARVAVSAVPSGGAPTLDVYLQTKNPIGNWQDIAHFPQYSGIDATLLAWGPVQGNVNGTQPEGSSVTVDNYFGEQSGALTVVTIRLLPLGEEMRVLWTFAAGGSTGDFTFKVDITAHS